MRWRESAVEWLFCGRSHVLCLASMLAGIIPTRIHAQNGADAKMRVTQVQQNCRWPDRLTVSLQVCNGGRRVVPRNTPVSFYTSDPRNPGARPFAAGYRLTAAVAPGRCQNFRVPLRVSDPLADSFYVVVNDNGRSRPFRLPNTGLAENDYANNITLATGFRFRATVMPQTDSLERGDFVRLSVAVRNAVPGRFSWYSPLGLSCTGCRAPLLHIVKGDSPKRLIAVSAQGCRDTSYSTLFIKPQADYSVVIDSVICAGDGRGYLHFRFCDNSLYGLLPDSIPISFYQGNPADGKLIGKPFVYHRTVPAICATDSFLLEQLFTGTITAVIHDTLLPAAYRFPAGGHFDEDVLANNSGTFNYAAPSLKIFPSDTTVIRGSSLSLKLESDIAGIVSYKWIPGIGTTLDCDRCQTPTGVVKDSAEIRAQVRTAYGCAVEARAILNVFPPDFTASLLESHCYKNDSLLVSFRLCTGNGYDSIPAGLPVSFSGRRTTGGPVTQLAPIYYTPVAKAGVCANYQLVIPKAADGLLTMTVNDGGLLRPSRIPLFHETNIKNNASDLQTVPFRFQLSTADTTVYRETEIALLPSVSGDEPQWVKWEPSLFLDCTQCTVNVARPEYNIVYHVKAATALGCTDSAMISIKTEAGGRVNIPNAFSPNGDGRNDFFYVTGRRDLVQVKHFSIFNRNGEKVMERSAIPPNDPAYGWDGNYHGRKAPIGGYLYFVTVTFSDGSEEQRRGTVVLLR